MIEIDRKYFGYVGRFEKMHCINYHFDIQYNTTFDKVKGLHIFFMKIYISIFVRIGIRK